MFVAVSWEIRMTTRLTDGWGRHVFLVWTGLVLVAAAVGRLDPAIAASNKSLTNVEQAYSQGEYDQAASLARSQTTPEAAVFTARALLTKAVLLPETNPEVLSLATIALGYADAARAANPSLVEAHLDAAIARGLQAEFLPTQAAIAKVEEARAAIDTALDLAPNDPWVLATYGGWHLTLTGRLGPLVANILFNARRDVGLTAFKRAFELSPDEPKLLFHYAKVRLLQGDGSAVPDARAALLKLQFMAPKDALGRTLLAMTPNLLAQIDATALLRSNEFTAYP